MILNKVDEASFIKEVMNKVLTGGDINFDEAERLLHSNDISTLANSSNTITRRFNGHRVDVESLINAKSGGCPEDCSFCAQSASYMTGINKYSLLSQDSVLEQARRVKESGANSFCLVCAYRSPPEKEFNRICQIIIEIKKKLKIDVNVSLGFISRDKARRLKSIGVKRYNHNLETSESYFSQICKTHDFYDRVNTAKIVKEVGLELCCGGIIGMGENPRQRLELAFALKALEPEEVPMNILIARKGTPLQDLKPLDPMDAIRTIAAWRFIMPKTILKIGGGREIHLKEHERMALKAGANGIITGGYLTTSGNNSNTDIAMIEEIGLSKA
jgi:biotin synthase